MVIIVAAALQESWDINNEIDKYKNKKLNHFISKLG